MLRASVQVGSEIKIGDVVIKVMEKSGQTVSLAIHAPKEMTIELPAKKKQEDAPPHQ